MGKRAARVFDGEVTGGEIMRWNRKAALWHMVHDDGDEEDLELAEVKAALRLATKQAAQDPRRAGAGAGAEGGALPAGAQKDGAAVELQEGGAWSTSHAYVGKRAARVFDGEVTGGEIMRWNRKAALWHMVHDDGDEEDLELAEVKAALRLATIQDICAL